MRLINYPNMKKIFFIASFLMLNSVMFSQDIVKNIRASFSDTAVYVFYDLEKLADIELYVSLDNGQSFTGPLKNVSGNIGKNQEQGNGKIIVWDAHKEFGDFESDQVKFKIITDEHSGNSSQNTTNSGHSDKHSYVDLGLPSGTLWATCNVGANTPEEYGDYFAWGETKSKSSYTKSKCSYIDNPTILPKKADAATINWGESWRMPTKEEFEELMDKCTWEWTTKNKKNGYLITGYNGNSIFLPASGFCFEDKWFSSYIPIAFYWSSTSYGEGVGAWSFYFKSDIYKMYNDYRYCGLTIRPVKK